MVTLVMVSGCDRVARIRWPKNLSRNRVISIRYEYTSDVRDQACGSRRERLYPLTPVATVKDGRAPWEQSNA
jgi:hypothetical protein